MCAVEIVTHSYNYKDCEHIYSMEAKPARVDCQRPECKNSKKHAHDAREDCECTSNFRYRTKESDAKEGICPKCYRLWINNLSEYGRK
ncbi:hypothetical protein DENSPDRAFT_672093 [Dentipellis sp. KUC8613]|nr:hypothetical protein DENSPDRAFT_672093 [Dentipellis sp. KUC8613]